MQRNNNNYKILFFNSTPDADEHLLSKLTLVNNPIDCLYEAAENTYDLVVIFHECRSFIERDALIELCSTLKRNKPTVHIPFLLLLPSRHRKMIEHLQNAGVEYVRFYDPCDPDLKHHIETLLKEPPKEWRIDKILADICPHINYFPMSRHKEILYCSAYRNRLVLGSYRLKHLCERSIHKICQYFKCPKLT